ncbi:MAG: hypothetical protein RLO01_12630 [Thalassobaculaceae bacterium]
MASKEFSLRLIFQVLDRATGPMRKIGGAIDRVGKATGLTRVAQASGALLTGLGRVGREAIAFGSRVTAGVAAAGAGLFALVKRSATAADKLGVGIQTLQQLRYAAGLAGVEQGKLDIATQRFTRRVAEAAAGTGVAKDALAALGIELKDGNGNIRATEDLLFDVADKMAAIEDPAKRVRLAFTLFDSEGVDMVNMLSKGSAAMRESFAEATRLGLITEEQARKSERFNDELSKLWVVIRNVGDVIAAGLLPAMQDGVVWLRAFMVENRPAVVEKLSAAIREGGAIVAWAASTWTNLTGALDAWIKAAILVSPIAANIITRLTGLIRSVGAARIVIGLLAAALGLKLVASILMLFVPLTQLGIALVAMTAKMTVLAAKGVATLTAGLFAMLPAIGSMIAATWAWTAALLANPLTWIFIAIMAAIGAVVGGMYLLIRHWDDVVAAFNIGWETIKGAFNRAWQAIRQSAAAALARIADRIAGAVSAIATLWSPITDAFERGVISGILALLATFNPASLFARAIDAMVAYLTGVSLIENGRAMIGGLVAGLASGADRLTAWLASIKDPIVQAFSNITALVSGTAGRIFRALDGIDLVAAGGAIVGGLLAGLAGAWGGVGTWFDDAIASLSDAVPSDVLVVAGGALVAGMLAGLRSAWGSVLAWIGTAIDGLEAWLGARLEKVVGWVGRRVDEVIGFLPDFIKEKTGLADRAADGNDASGVSSPVPSALAPGSQEIGGEIRVRFENAPRDMRVADKRSDTPGVSLGVDTGYAMGH